MIHRCLLLMLVATVSCYGNTHFADTSLLHQHLHVLTKTEGFRTHKNITLLNKTADYIFSVFAMYADTVFFQEYNVDGKIYKNIIGAFATQSVSRIIVGAHYDVCHEQEGADDNASGVVGLLELARLLQHKPLSHRIDLVAYSLEEPPYFRTNNMGSYVHAQSLSTQRVPVAGMVSLEMIGYFNDQKKTQDYPIGALSLFYGTKGNYITLVKKWGSGKFSRHFCSLFKNTKTLRTKTFSGPKSLSGIDFSDHLNYWRFGYSALMITDTAFYRNKNYHQHTDTLDTLDLARMAKVVDGVFKTLLTI